jgi:hypothetical protein
MPTVQDVTRRAFALSKTIVDPAAARFDVGDLSPSGADHFVTFIFYNKICISSDMAT